MIFELRTYDLLPGKALKYLGLFRTGGVHLITRHLPLAGYWMTESGGLNRIHHLWAYESLQERTLCRLAVAKDREWNDQFVPNAFTLVVSQRNAFLSLETSSKLLDGVVARRKEAHQQQIESEPMFGEDWYAIAISAQTLPPETPGLVAGFRTVSGYRPQSHFTLIKASQPDLLMGYDGAPIEHELIRPLALSPLR
ncbi:hypothetical protein J2046_006803 [Rhizobium petrolearium]|uniref:NIPSNAP family protein n=2 Tax=Neorhizobium TaxID=1525371 RepID=A0ABV0MG17_9HYPH|nr:NIPSNAP family protein [Neorhizobium petrolearium]MBP1848507.1 hypothetical protein [Neorhizobium petrolearium]MCC2614528.1 NIPSNAP family protein [Neorhizobium petrolearium]WGI72287.1 NIPSNAP family protein [Neorhizobium petrolearium]